MLNHFKPYSDSLIQKCDPMDLVRLCLPASLSLKIKGTCEFMRHLNKISSVFTLENQLFSNLSTVCTETSDVPVKN